MGERFLEFLQQLLQSGLWYLLSLFNGYVLFRLTVPFLSLRKKWWWRAILLLLFAGSSSMVIWVGDPNLLYTCLLYTSVFGAFCYVKSSLFERKASHRPTP